MNVKSQNLSIMLTDIQGYTSTSSASSRNDIVKLILKYNQLMVPVITFYGGTVIKTIGDAFLCTFPSATDAVVCAIIIQLLLKEYNKKQLDESKKISLRIVINTGDVSIVRNDIFGDAVNIVSRMEKLDCFTGGTIGISESTYLLMNKNEIFVEKIGAQQLKGIPEPITVYKVPLEKQKITDIPINLLKLVERAIQNENTTNNSISNLIEWNNAILQFLKEKKFGEGISNILDEQKILNNLNTLQNKVVSKLAEKTVIDLKDSNNYKEAKILSRIKATIIDMFILFIIWIISYYILWHPIKKITFGNDEISISEITSFEDIKDLDIEENKMLKLSKHKERFEKNIELIKKKIIEKRGDIKIPRKKGMLEMIIEFNIKYPLILICIYLTLFWMIKGATIGQIIVKNAVVTDNNEKLNFILAFKRSFLFILSILVLGIGLITIFSKLNKTLYDYLCETKVIE